MNDWMESINLPALHLGLCKLHCVLSKFLIKDLYTIKMYLPEKTKEKISYAIITMTITLY